MNNIPSTDVKIKDGFWRFYSDLNRNHIVENVYTRFKETGRFDAFRCDWHEGMPNKPHIYWDSDVVKWIEGVAYITGESPVPEWEAEVDQVVDYIVANQRSDGYFNSYFLSIDPSKIFTNRAG